MIAVALLLAAPPAPLPGFRPGPWVGEQVREAWVAVDVRAVMLAATDHHPLKPTRLIVYATPNGNSVEQTLGCRPAAGLDWRFGIQHVAAQVRAYRRATPTHNVVLACVEPLGLSWPAWRAKHADAPARAAKLLDALRGWLPNRDPPLTLAAHSGGGGLLWCVLDAAPAVRPDVERIAFLDANYSYADAHGDKLLAWLKADAARRLVVVAYDDREVTLNGKKVVGPAGGTFRATERMRARFAADAPLATANLGTFDAATWAGGRAGFYVHPNPRNRILHTALVGDMNGLLFALTGDAAASKFGGPPAYADLVQPAPGIPPRPANAPGGAAFLKSLLRLTPAEREAAVGGELLRGNVPDFLRQFVPVSVTAGGHTATFEVMPDYLAVGSDADFVRLPMTPQTAVRVADAFGCSLPTRKMTDAIYSAATVKLEPQPLTKDRDATATFGEHHAVVEEQRRGRKLGPLVAGHKKDVVISNRVAERPNRLALYGWHRPDGTPVQPLTVVHVDRYVDYSHGVRLVRRAVTVDGKPVDIRPALVGDRHPLLSDEGPLLRPAY